MHRVSSLESGFVHRYVRFPLWGQDFGSVLDYIDSVDVTDSRNAPVR